LLDLIASLRANGRDTAFGLVAGRDGPLLAQAEALGVRVFLLPLGDHLAAVGDSALVGHGLRSIPAFGRRAARATLDVARYIPRLAVAIRQFSPAVVHSNGIKMHLLAAAAGSQARLLWHIRDLIGERPLVSRALRACAWRAHGAIAISNAVANDARRVLPRLPIHVVHDAIDTELFSPDGPVADLDGLAGTDPAPAGTVRIGLVATYARWKGHDVFLKAARMVTSRQPKCRVRFYVVGGAIYDTAASQYQTEELLSMARELGIENVTSFVPFQARVDAVFRALDVVVHASTRTEPFGRTIAEAMATGRAVIASRSSGAAELYTDGADAVGIEPLDPVGLADAMYNLLEDTPRRARLAATARITAVERFSRTRLAGQVLRVYREAGCLSA
jgi:glycosyltransferase involved in cell wall biosynthesis